MAPSPTAALNEIVSTAAAILGLTRPGRLREQLSSTLDLYERAQAHGHLSPATEDLTAVINALARRLREAACPSTKRAWAVGPAFITLSAGAIIAIPDIWLSQYIGQWWAILLVAVDGLVASFFVIVALGLLLERKPVEMQVPVTAELATTGTTHNVS
jgi:hypothetical protein